MKSIKFIMAVILAVSAGTFSHAQGTSKVTAAKTETVKVSGNCELCKARIEKAATIEGVKKAEWNKDSKILTLVYNPAVVNGEDIQKKIAAAGHDTEKFKASEAAYKSLPGCCRYERIK